MLRNCLLKEEIHKCQPSSNHTSYLLNFLGVMHFTSLDLLFDLVVIALCLFVGRYVCLVVDVCVNIHYVHIGEGLINLLKTSPEYSLAGVYGICVL